MAIRDIWSECNYNPLVQLLFYPNGLLLRDRRLYLVPRQLAYLLLNQGPLTRKGGKGYVFINIRRNPSL